MHLLSIEDTRFCEVFEVLVVSEDLDQESCLFEPVLPILKSLHNCESFFIRYSIITFSWVHQFQHETDWMMSIIHLFLGQDGSIHIIQHIGFHLELSIQIGVCKNRSLTDLPFQEFKGTMLIFGPLPGLVLLEKVM